MKKLIQIVTILILVLSLTGCGSKEKQKFTIVYLPNESTVHNVDSRKVLRDDLSKAINMEVVEIQANDYNAVIEAMRTGNADMAYFGPLSFALAYQRAGVEPIGMKAKNRDKSKATYKSLLITKKSRNDINAIKDIKGKSMAFVDPNSTSGGLIPTGEIINYFSGEKLTVEDLRTNGRFFSTVIFSGQHQAGLQAVLRGDVDVVPISDAIMEAEINNGRAKREDIKIIHKSAPIPSEPLAIRKDLPKELKNKVKEFMLAYDNSKYFELNKGLRREKLIF